MTERLGDTVAGARTVTTSVLGLVLIAGLTACSPSAEPASEPEQQQESSSSPEAQETDEAEPDSETDETDEAEPDDAEEPLPLSAETLETIFVENQFDPTEFSSVEEMFASIYPDVTIAPACLEVLGIGTTPGDASMAFGPSIDHTLTAQIVSSGTEADSFYAALSASADACISDPQLTFGGQPIDAVVERNGDRDNAFGLTLSATINSTQITVIGMVEQFQENVVAVAGWDPQTNERNVPAAKGIFIEKVADARIDRVNETN